LIFVVCSPIITVCRNAFRAPLVFGIRPTLAATNAAAMVGTGSLAERGTEVQVCATRLHGQVCAPRVHRDAKPNPAAYPKDPADRIIGATALVEGLSLLTADRAIRRSRALQSIW
jgi:predicted nucleic acid-binding protein